MINSASPGGGGRGIGGTHYISMGRDVLTEGVLFSASVWKGVGGRGRGSL